MNERNEVASTGLLERRMTMKVDIELDDLNELRDQVEHLERELANQTYAGNSISYIHQKMTNYGNQLGLLGPFVKRAVEEGRLVLRQNVETDHRVAALLRLPLSNATLHVPDGSAKRGQEVT